MNYKHERTKTQNIHTKQHYKKLLKARFGHAYVKNLYLYNRQKFEYLFNIYIRSI